MKHSLFANTKIFFATFAVLMICTWNVSSQSVEPTNVAPPANDNFANAITLTGCCSTTVGTTVEATKEVGEPNHAGFPGGHSVWYKWTYSLGYVGGFTLSTRQSSAPFDTLLGVYTGSSVNALTTVASSDDYGSTPTTRTSTLFFQAVPGTTYYFAIDGFGNESGTFTLDLDINRTHARSNHFKGSGFSAVSVFRPSDGNWYVTSNTGVQVVHWGANGDIPAPADYDGDKITDFAVFRPSDGTWHVLQSQTDTYRALRWGQSGDTPVPGDYFFLDGYDEFVLFRPSTGTWYGTTGVVNTVVQFGSPGDKPATRDYDNDGKIDLAVFRPSTGTWYIQNSRDFSNRIQQWGASGDIPVPGGYVATGDADIAVWRPSDGNWYIYHTHDNSYEIKHFGQNGDIPQPIDYGAVAGLSDLGIFRPSTGTWYIQETSGQFYAFPFGLSGDIPTATAYPVLP